MKSPLVALLLIAAFATACTQQPNVPLVQGVTPRKAIEIKYVGIPHMNIHVRAFDDAPVISTYGFGETVAVLSTKEGWTEVRTFDGGAAWVHSKDLVNLSDLKAYLDDPKPRFYIPPVAVAAPPRVHGTLVFQAKVNTDGEVYEVTTVQNTTRSAELEHANVAALRAASFYPLIQKGNLRAAFTYDHKVVY